MENKWLRMLSNRCENPNLIIFKYVPTYLQNVLYRYLFIWILAIGALIGDVSSAFDLELDCDVLLMYGGKNMEEGAAN